MGFHPKTNGHYERMIQILNISGDHIVKENPSKWSQQLSLAEFVVNNAVRVADGYGPFCLNAEEHPIVLYTFAATRGTNQV